MDGNRQKAEIRDLGGSSALSRNCEKWQFWWRWTCAPPLQVHFVSCQLAANESLQHSVLMNAMCRGPGVEAILKDVFTLRVHCKNVGGFFSPELCHVFVPLATFPVIFLKRTANYMCFMSPITHFHYADARCNMDLLSYPSIKLPWFAIPTVE